MLISELARRADLPVATVKFYLREGIVHAGEVTSRTRASYDDHHVRRLRLVRALVDVGHLSLADVRRVLATLDDPARSTLDLLGDVHEPLTPPPSEPDARWMAEADALLARLGWDVNPESSPKRVLAEALAACDEVGHPLDDEVLETYAKAALDVAVLDVAGLPSDDRALAVEAVVLGTVLREPILLALRRLAQQHVSIQRFSGFS